MYIIRKIKVLKGFEKYGRYVYTLIRVIVEFILFLAEGSIGDVKAARIRANKKGGYAYK